MNILVFSQVCIDHNVSEGAEYTAAGSPGMFMAKIFTLFDDVDFTVVSHYGRDFKQYLGNIAIYPREPVSAATFIYENSTKSGIRTQRGLLRQFASPVEIDENLKELIQKADVIIFAPILPNYSTNYIGEIVSYKKEGAVTILLPQGYFRDFDREDNVIEREFVEAADIMPLVDIVIVSEQDHPQIEPMVIDWVKTGKTTALVTLGPGGAEIIQKGGRQLVAPLEVVAEDQIIDSVGAGDIFSASFIYHYMKTRNMPKSVESGNMVAGKSLFYTPDQLDNLRAIVKGFQAK